MLNIHQEAVAVVQYTVGVDGLISGCRLLASFASRQAADSLKEWLELPGLKYSPSRLANMPIAVYHVWKLVFALASTKPSS